MSGSDRGAHLAARERHPGLVGSAADAAGERHVQAVRPRLAEHAGPAEVAGQGRRQCCEVLLPDHVHVLVRCGQCGGAGALLPLVVEAAGSVGGVAQRRQDEQQDVDGRADLRVLPGREDHGLGGDGGDCFDSPPQVCADGQQRRGQRHHDRRGEPRPADADTDRLRERPDLRPAESLRGAEQVESCVRGNDRYERQAHPPVHVGLPPSADHRSAVRTSSDADTAVLRSSGARGRPVGAQARTTRTGHGACCTSWVLVEPRSSPVKPPRPREPTTSRSCGRAAVSSCALG